MTSTLGLLFACGSLACATANDVVFKVSRSRSRACPGCLLAGIGVIWTLVFLACLAARGGGAWEGWIYGILAGASSAVANLLLLEALARMEAGTASTIYRLNLVWAMLLAVLFLGESLTGGKLAALVLALLAIGCLGLGTARSSPLEAKAMLGLLLLAGLLRGGMGILFKLGYAAGAGQYELLALSGACWIAGGLAWSAWRGPRGARIGCDRWVLASGVLVCGIVFFLTGALEHLEASVAVPITQLNFVGTAILGVIILKEPMGRWKAAGLACAVGCLAVLALWPGVNGGR